MSKIKRREINVEVNENFNVALFVPTCWVKPMVMSLCSRCAGYYYADDKSRIVRANYNQKIYDKCDICGRNKAYDFIIFEKIDNLQQAKK